MTKPDPLKTAFPSAEEDASSAELKKDSPQTLSPSYQLAYTDKDFLLRDELRPVRLQLELLKPELLQHEHNIHSTVVIFGSTRIPEHSAAKNRVESLKAQCKSQPDDPLLKKQLTIAQGILEKSKYYDEARKLGHLITRKSQEDDNNCMVVITGGGPGIMEAANRGAHDANGKSIGLNIVLPFEQCPNAYITPELTFQFHYFAIRKMEFLMRAKALVAFPGGFGTLDELFETLTLIQTKKVKRVPVLLFGKEFWSKIINFESLVDEGVINIEDLELIQYVESAEEAWSAIADFYNGEIKQ